MTDIHFSCDEVDRRYAVWLLSQAIENGDCLDCHFSPVKKGYSYTKADRGEPRERAHRFIWRCIHGPIGDNLLILHTCDNRRCINPSHLFIGTAQDNTQDMMAKGRHKYILPNNNKLTEDQIVTMKQLRDKGASYATIGAEFGVCASTVINNLRDRI